MRNFEAGTTNQKTFENNNSSYEGKLTQEQAIDMFMWSYYFSQGDYKLQYLILSWIRKAFPDISLPRDESLEESLVESAMQRVFSSTSHTEVIEQVGQEGAVTYIPITRQMVIDDVKSRVKYFHKSSKIDSRNQELLEDLILSGLNVIDEDYEDERLAGELRGDKAKPVITKSFLGTFILSKKRTKNIIFDTLLKNLNEKY